MKILLPMLAISTFFLVANIKPETTQTKVGVVNIKACSEKSDFVKDMEKKFKDAHEGYRKEISKMDAEISDLEYKYKETPEGSGYRQELFSKIVMAKSKREAQVKINATILSLDWQRHEVEFYNHILEMAATIGKEKGLDAVFRVGVTPKEEKGEADDIKVLSHKIRYETVIYYASTIDITEDVVKRLNAEYAKIRDKKPN